jgi:hypothetical protein
MYIFFLFFFENSTKIQLEKNKKIQLNFFLIFEFFFLVSTPSPVPSPPPLPPPMPPPLLSTPAAAPDLAGVHSCSDMRNSSEKDSSFAITTLQLGAPSK